MELATATKFLKLSDNVVVIQKCILTALKILIYKNLHFQSIHKTLKS